MMYAAGLTVREIADRCHQIVATVHLHLQVREKYSPGLRATHEAALARRDPDRPTTSWRRRLVEALAFHATHQRLPSSQGDVQERSMAQWVATQRIAYQQGKMAAAKIILLDQLPNWNVNQHQQRLDEIWKAKLAAVVDFVTVTGNLPRYRNYVTEHERALGVWLHNQHQKRTKGTLAEWRKTALNDAMPAWRSRG
ncbi:helicase associated domain-containing protein [Glutamicibacter sp. 0426]|uniref:helicase associated domain-containing protein n=1 Tax=Glutamicibacter sp. 0426 TaxID=1913445 RepID=UPI000938EA0A|nr:helicase associated domain-containing protein [Glutamicibacter sp. 0426]